MKPDCPPWAPPLLALQFLTRVPVPGVGRLSEEAVRVGLGRAVAWFPLVGAVVGSITAGTMLLAEQVWPRLVVVIVALVIEALITGAFHEDAVADFCDGVGGGRNPEHVRQIMKDSRIGSYGALGLTLGVSLRAALMYALAESLTLPAIIAAATLGRLTAVAVMATTPPAPTAERGPNVAASPLPCASVAGRGTNAAASPAPLAPIAGEPNVAADSLSPASRAHRSFGVAPNPPSPASAAGRAGKPAANPTSIASFAPTSLASTFGRGIRTRDVALAFAMALPGLLPFALAAPLRLLCAVLATITFLLWFRPLVMREVGGATGDCLGFAVYAAQLLLLLAATAW
jgi:cobalamin synthase